MVLSTVTYLLLGIGCCFNLLAAIGLLRFPDAYTRLHAGTKCTTFGALFLVAGVALQSAAAWFNEGISSAESVLTIHALIALIAILITNPTSSHAIARAAHRYGYKPVQAIVDDLEEESHD